MQCVSIDNTINLCQSVSATMTCGLYPNLKKFRSHGSAHRSVYMASTGIISPHTFNYYSFQLSQRLSEPQSTSWPHKPHFNAPSPRLQGSASSSRSRRFPAVTFSCVIHHTYHDIQDKDLRRSASRSSCTGSFRAEMDLSDLAKISFFFAKPRQCARKSLIC